MHLISGSYDYTVIIWSVKEKFELFQLDTGSEIEGVTITNDNTLIAVNTSNGEIKIWNFEIQKLLLT